MASETILRFHDARLPGAPLYELGLGGVDFVLAAGDLALADLGGRHVSTALADAAQGLVDPVEGAVEFLGAAWPMPSPARAAACRGMTGRVFDTRSWISNLDVDENVTLAQRHHTGRLHDDLAREAEALARALHLAEIPRARPAVVPRQDLRLAEWIRAFLGTPKLVILEDPLRGVAEEFMENLLRGVASARERGTAVLWIAGSARERGIVEPLASTVVARHGAAPLAAGS